MRAIVAIARTEFKLGLRNSWIVLSTITLTLFSLLLVLLSSGTSSGLDAHLLRISVASLSTLSVYVIPLIALLLSFDAIAGEIDRGTLQLTLATPIARWQFLAGKFCGHFCVLSVAVLVGFGVAGGFAFWLGGMAGWDAIGALGRLTASSLLLGSVFILIGYLASALVRQTSTAAALALGIWLLAVVLYDLALLGGLIASGDGYFARTVFPWLLLANPADAFRVLNMSAVDADLVRTGLGTGAGANVVSAPIALISPLFWAALSTTLTIIALRRISP